MRIKAVFLCVCLITCEAVAGPFSITHMSNTGNGVSLSWDNSTDLYIVAQSPTLTGQFQYVANVLSTNGTTVSNDFDTCFYRIREVHVVQFPDAMLAAIVQQALPFSHSTNQFYDIDVEAITNLSVEGNGQVSIRDATGIKALTGLQTLYFYGVTDLTNLDLSGCTNLQSVTCCNGRDLSQLNVSGCTNLHFLNCSGNNISSLNLSACTSLQSLYCGNNQISALDISACTKLQCLSCYEDYNLGGLNICSNPALTQIDVRFDASFNIVVPWTPPSNVPSTITILYMYSPPTLSN